MTLNLWIILKINLHQIFQENHQYNKYIKMLQIETKFELYQEEKTIKSMNLINKNNIFKGSVKQMMNQKFKMREN